MAQSTLTSTQHTDQNAALAVLFTISFCHFLNDLIQSLLPAIYPILKINLQLSFAQIGLITLAWQLTASLLQPVVGHLADRKPRPYSLALGMTSTLSGLLLLAVARHYALLLLAAALIGIGSSVFHPESSRVARMASGGRHGFAQSMFQVGGNLGSAAGPLLAAFIVLARGQASIAWFSLVALVAAALLWVVGRWYQAHGVARLRSAANSARIGQALPHRIVVRSVAVLMALIFSKYFYLASLTSYYTLYLIHRFHVSVQSAQIHLFVFLGAVAIGTFAGGPLGDRFGRKYVIWFSILGVLPFTLMLPHVGLFWTGLLSIVIGLILSSAFAAIVVYGQELMPGRVGTIAGLFFGFAFGMGGVGAAVLGWLADQTSIEFVYRICAFLPAIGLLAALLPNLDTRRGQARQALAA